jgi:hypothetical protein
MSNKIELGLRGYYGHYLLPSNNVIVAEMNLLIDEYNSKINSFDTYEEQLSFRAEINSKIDELSKNIK